MSPTIYRLLFAFITAFAFIFCDFLSATWAKNNSIFIFIIMILLAPLGYFMFGLMNRSHSLSINSGLVNMIIILGTICVGLFWFHDKLNIKEYIGIIFAICAMALLI